MSRRHDESEDETADRVAPLAIARKMSGMNSRNARDNDHDVDVPPSTFNRRQSRAAVDALRKLPVFRRLSIAPIGIGRKGSIAGYTDLSSLLSHSRAPAKMENTYQLAPADDQKFSIAQVEMKITSILESYLDGEEYEERKCGLLARNISDVIKSRVKDMDMPRYKIVCLVTMGQIADECVQFVSRCVWSADTDNYASKTYRNNSLFCTVVVYGVYFEWSQLTLIHKLTECGLQLYTLWLIRICRIPQFPVIFTKVK